MENPIFTERVPERCAYISACYLAESLRCFGYKKDCPLYQQSSGLYLHEEEFNTAMDKLIDQTRTKHLPSAVKNLK
jgi:hypothetical protein